MYYIIIVVIVSSINTKSDKSIRLLGHESINVSMWILYIHPKFHSRMKINYFGNKISFALSSIAIQFGLFQNEMIQSKRMRTIHDKCQMLWQCSFLSCRYCWFVWFVVWLKMKNVYLRFFWDFIYLVSFKSRNFLVFSFLLLNYKLNDEL